MNNTHRYLIQYMLKNGCVNLQNALEYCQRVSGGNITNETGLKTLFIEVNREISKQFFKIQVAKCEVTEEEMVVWVNMKNDKISKMQITFSELELEYFQAIVQEILHSPGRKLTVIVCINITSTLTGVFSRESGEKALNKWMKIGYFIIRGDYVHLGVRTILEFTSYLRSSCPNCLCMLCSEIVFTGKICAFCEKIYHAYCLNRYCNSQEICPNCKREWREIEAFTDVNQAQTQNGSVESDNESDENRPGPSQRRIDRDKNHPGPSQRRIDRDENRPGPTQKSIDRDENRPGPSQRRIDRDKNHQGPSQRRIDRDENHLGPSQRRIDRDENRPGPSQMSIDRDENRPGPSERRRDRDENQAGSSQRKNHSTSQRGTRDSDNSDSDTSGNSERSNTKKKRHRRT